MLQTLLLQVSDWALFFGRFHPVLVHLPIGFLLVAAVLEVGRRLGRISVSASTITFILFWSAVGATVACGAGYLLSLGGGYDEELLDEHMWQGIGVAVFAWVAWVAQSDVLGGRVPFAPLLYGPALVLSSLLVFAAGHHGGSLTHGDGYLTQYTPEPFRSLAGLPPRLEEVTEIKPIADVPQAVVYHDIIRPILSVHCTQCHNPTKQKGGLRLDDFEQLMKGGENGSIVLIGKSTSSEMIRRCLLPIGEEEHMPPKGKTQLSEEQIALLSWWIDQGAPRDKKVADLKVDEKIKPALASLSESNAESATTGSVLASIKAEAPDSKALAEVTETKMLVIPVAREQHLIEVSAINASSFSDAQMPLLIPLSPQLVWLKLGHTQITNAALADVAQLKNLNKLHLQYTQVGDEGLKHLQNLPYLEYINLVGTRVTDEGLQNLAKLKSLRNVYVWKSGVTEAGVARLKRIRPDLLIETGLDEAAVAQFLKAGQENAADTLPKPTKL